MPDKDPSARERTRDLAPGESAWDRNSYLVLTDRLTWPADRAIVERLLAGEDIPHDQRGELREAVKGDIVTDLVPESIPWMIVQRLIEPAPIDGIEWVFTTGFIEPLAGD